MKKFFAAALLTMGLILNVGAQTGPGFVPGPPGFVPGRPGFPSVPVVPGVPGPPGFVPGPPVSVPEDGSTVVLLGLGLVALAALYRKKALA